MRRRVIESIFLLLGGLCLVRCAPAVHPASAPWDIDMTELWQRPFDLPERDLIGGPWGRDRAPDQENGFRLIAGTQVGAEGDLTVMDSQARVWHVRRSDRDGDSDRGDSEVVLSRVLSAVGYHQPPVYFLRSFSLVDGSGIQVQRGGRFLLDERSLRDRGRWRWGRNPFVGTSPYQGLLVILMIFNGTNLGTENNHVYDVTASAERASTWYVVQNLSNDLGEHGFRLPRSLQDGAPPLLSTFEGPSVALSYPGHPEFTRGRISRHDVWWASELLARLDDRQWRDAFAAAGYEPRTAAPLLARLKNRIASGRRLGSE